MGPEGDLVHGKWLPIVPTDGAACEASLLEVLTAPESVRRLSLPTPTMVPALLRQVLLPVVLDALGVPRTIKEWRERFQRGRFSKAEVEQLTSYLGPSRYGDHFLLFPTTSARPFAQAGGLTARTGETKPSTLLIPSIATGNNVPLFSAFSEADDLALTPAQAALWLLHAQCWDTAAIKTGAVGDPQAAKGNKTTGNPTGPLGQFGVVMPTGRTLYETLVLNTPILPGGLDSADRPQWAGSERLRTAGEMDPAGPEWSVRSAHGLLDLLTFQSRRIRLIPCQTPTGLRVRQVVVCAGDRLTFTPAIDPHATWNHTVKPKAGEPPLRPRRHSSARASWQGLNALLALTASADSDGPSTSALLRQAGELRAEGALPVDYPLGVEIYGLEYGNQSAVVENAIADAIPLPVSSLVSEDTPLRQAVLDCVEQADQVGRALDRLHADLRRAAGGDPLPRDKGEAASVRFLHGVDRSMRRLLAGLRTAGDNPELVERGQHAWEKSLRRDALDEAHSLLAATPPRAAVGRIIKVNGKETTFRSGSAEGAFRKSLLEILQRVPEGRSLNEKEAA
ncbi:type I-E CRISPR-associated protein Cse1/CasA [Streptomyces sp. NPDC088354]|uniref:type I-E CRISPR-associated protein Cse1/CasA n=1 Tax=Streptomyces sp. NPDC088354 TaxID=3365856 RepID=UPI00381AFDDC